MELSQKLGWIFNMKLFWEDLVGFSIMSIYIILTLIFRL